MSKHTIADLRNHLFSTLEALKDKDNPMDIERAKAICEVSQTIINTAKVEVEHQRVTGGRTASDFLPQATLPAPAAGAKEPEGTTLTATGTKTVTALGHGASVITHRMK